MQLKLVLQKTFIPNCYKFAPPRKIIIVVIFTYSRFTQIYVPKNLEKTPAHVLSQLP